VHALVQAQIPECRHEGWHAGRTSRLCLEVPAIEKFPERRVARRPDGRVERIGILRRGVKLDVQRRVEPRQAIVDQLAQRMIVVCRLSADHETQRPRLLAIAVVKASRSSRSFAWPSSS
jgi:hypothetical protein